MRPGRDIREKTTEGEQRHGTAVLTGRQYADRRVVQFELQIQIRQALPEQRCVNAPLGTEW